MADEEERPTLDHEDLEDSPEITTCHYSASGKSVDDCVFLAQRYNAAWGYKPLEGECWVVAVKRIAGKLTMSLHLGTTAWYTRLWSNGAGTVFVSRADGLVLRNPDVYATDAHLHWVCDELPDCSAWGVWGLHEQSVFAWGGRQARRGYDLPEGVVFHFDGHRWNELPPPGFRVQAMHGVAPDQVWAAGWMGGIARWDGHRWGVRFARSREVLTSIFVVNADEIYATGNRGTVFEGSQYGFVPIVRFQNAMPGDLQAIAKWKGGLWVAGSTLGLLKRRGHTDRFVPAPELDPLSLDARWDLLAATKDRLLDTSDGSTFNVALEHAVLNARQNIPLGQF